MQIQLKAEWTIIGVVVERRVKTSEKSKEWRQPTIKVQTLGDTFDLDLDDKLYEKTGEGECLTFTGRFDRRPGKQGGIYTNFIVTGVGPVQQSRGAVA